MRIINNIKLALIACGLLLSNLAHAGPIDFIFTDPATINFGSLGAHSFSGGFTYDASTSTLTNVNVTMTGAVNTTFNGTWSAWNSNTYIGLTSAGDNNDNGVMAFLQFSSSLSGSVTPSFFTNGGGNAIYNTAYGNAFSGAAVGGVEVPTEVPEPNMLFLLGLSLAGLGLAKKRKYS